MASFLKGRGDVCFRLTSENLNKHDKREGG